MREEQGRGVIRRFSMVVSLCAWKMGKHRDCRAALGTIEISATASGRDGITVEASRLSE